MQNNVHRIVTLWGHNRSISENVIAKYVFDVSVSKEIRGGAGSASS